MRRAAFLLAPLGVVMVAGAAAAALWSALRELLSDDNGLTEDYE